MIYKIIGTALVFISGLYLSGQYSARLRYTLTLARDAERFSAYVYESILYKNALIPDILRQYKSEDLCSADFFTYAADNITALDRVLDSPAALPYDEETKLIMIDFLSMLGKGYRDSQLKLCLQTQSRLQKHIEALQSSQANSLKVGRSICIFTFISILILLL